MMFQPEDGAQVFKEQPPWQEVTRVQDNGREQKQEESIGAESRGGGVTDSVDHPSDKKAHHDEETALWDHCRHSARPVET